MGGVSAPFAIFAVCALASAAVASAQVVYPPPTAPPAILIEEGIVQGFFAKPAPDLTNCATGVVHIFNDTATAIEDFELGTAEGLKEAFAALSLLIDDVEADLKSCAFAKAELDRLHKAAQKIKSWKEAAFDVLTNLIATHHPFFIELEQAVDQWVAQDWKPFGISVGDALEKLLVGPGYPGDADPDPTAMDPSFDPFASEAVADAAADPSDEGDVDPDPAALDPSFDPFKDEANGADSEPASEPAAEEAPVDGPAGDASFDPFADEADGGDSAAVPPLDASEPAKDAAEEPATGANDPAFDPFAEDAEADAAIA